jgi:hypothetical protein
MMARGYSTRMDWFKSSSDPKGGHWAVSLLRDDLEIAVMSLKAWMELSAVQFAADEMAWVMAGRPNKPEQVFDGKLSGPRRGSR